MAIHFGTFALGDDGEFEPVVKLREALNIATTAIHASGYWSTAKDETCFNESSECALPWAEVLIWHPGEMIKDIFGVCLLSIIGEHQRD
jgi:hypothetical protein